MRQTAEQPTSGAAPTTADARPIRVLPGLPAAEVEKRERLIRSLAADRLRDLRDEGLTLGRIARVYGVEPDDIEGLISELIPSRFG